jgi:uncharacterized protein YeaO (DUF488 family)
LKILQEIESHHGSSDVIVKSILNQLYTQSFPKAGCGITFKNWKTNDVSPSADLRKNSLHRSSLNLGDFSNFTAKSEENLDHSTKSLESGFKHSKNQRRKSTDLSNKFPNVQNGATMIKSLEKIYSGDKNDKQNKKNLSNPKDCVNQGLYSKNSMLNRSFIMNVNKISTNVFHHDEMTSRSDVVMLKRSVEPRIEEDNLYILFDTICVDILLKIFGSLLLERKVIIVGDKLR